MANLNDIKTRVLTVLEDSEGRRFSANLLEAAIRQALEEIDQRMPRIVTAEVNPAVTGRDQPLEGLERCQYLVSVTWPAAGDNARELEPDTQFTYYLKDGVPTLHFSGRTVPQTGDALTVRYASANSLEGLDEALTTTLTAACESALVNGAAGQACLLRAGGLAERYGNRPEEAARLMEIGRLWLNTFARTLEGLKVLQDFGFPPGFALDPWDRVRG